MFYSASAVLFSPPLLVRADHNWQIRCYRVAGAEEVAIRTVEVAAIFICDYLLKGCVNSHLMLTREPVPEFVMSDGCHRM